MIKNITTYLGSLRALETDDTTLWTNGERLTADKDRVSSRILSPLQWFDEDDDSPTKGDEFEHLLPLEDESSEKNAITKCGITTIKFFYRLHQITPKYTIQIHSKYQYRQNK